MACTVDTRVAVEINPSDPIPSKVLVYPIGPITIAFEKEEIYDEIDIYPSVPSERMLEFRLIDVKNPALSFDEFIR